MPDLSVPEIYVLTSIAIAGGMLTRAAIASLPTEVVGGVPRLVRRKLAGFDPAGDTLGLTAAGQVIFEELESAVVCAARRLRSRPPLRAEGAA